VSVSNISIPVVRLEPVGLELEVTTVTGSTILVWILASGMLLVILALVTEVALAAMLRVPRDRELGGSAGALGLAAGVPVITFSEARLFTPDTAASST
jgi:hypothetical protein